MLHGCDISENNNRTGFDVNWFRQWQFVGIRVMNEHGRIDTAFRTNWNNCKLAGVPRLAYAWPIAGHDNAQLARQLVSLTPDSECGWWADYEHSGAGLASHSELEDFVRACDGGFYSNLSELPRSAYLDTRPWWFANPSNNPSPRSVLVEQYGVINGIDVDTASESLLTGADVLTADEHKWLQAIYIRLGGDNGFDGNALKTVEDVVKENKASGTGTITGEIKF